MQHLDPFIHAIREQGYAIAEDVVAATRLNQIARALHRLPHGEEVRRRENVYGIRNLLGLSDEVRQLAACSDLRSFVEPILGAGCFAVRATFFDKVPDANWKLRYHQDSVIAVKERKDEAGYQAWSEKAGVLQVRPPTHVLHGMLAIRVHLDPCPEENGALRVLPGSHRKRWQRHELSQCKAVYDEHVCAVRRGGVLAMRPLLLHASGASETPGHRRVVHIEYASDELPGGLEWRHRAA